MGDLNDDPMDPSCAEVLGAKRNVKDVEEGGWYNPWWNVLASGVGTLAYRGQWNLFDQIIINYNLVGKDRTFASGVYLNGYSDHFPTQIFLTRELK